MWIDPGFSRTHQTTRNTKLTISLILVGLLVALFSSFLVPIILAAVFGLALEPFVSKMVKPHENRKISFFAIFFSLLSLFLLPLFILSFSFYAELNTVAEVGISKSNTYQFFTESRDHFIFWVNAHLPKVSLQSSLQGDRLFDGLLNKTYDLVTLAVSGLMSGLPSFLLSLFVFSVALFFFVSQSRKIKRFSLSLHLLPRSDFEFILAALKKSSSITLLSSVVIGISQATLITLASLVFHTGKPGIVFGATFLLSFVPIIGTTPVSLTLIAMVFFNHHAAYALGFVGVAIVSSILDQIIRTLWMSEVSAIHPIIGFISFISLLGALHLFGISGLFFGPLIIGIAGQILPQFIREKVNPKRLTDEGEQSNSTSPDVVPLTGEVRPKDTHGHWYS